MGISKTMAEYTKALKDFVAKVLNFTSKKCTFLPKNAILNGVLNKLKLLDVDFKFCFAAYIATDATALLYCKRHINGIVLL